MTEKTNLFHFTNDKFLIPKYRISPYDTTYIKTNYSLLRTRKQVDNEYNFENGYLGKNLIITESGKSAIKLAIESYDLNKNDYITILTTSGNSYISGCVTKTIEEYCKWDRKISNQTKLLFIIHEFGFPFDFPDTVINSGIPIIEDCAYSFYSQNKEASVGEIGDFAIFSLPKIFPVHYGGLLKVNKKDTHISKFKDLNLNNNDYKFLYNVVTQYSKYKLQIINKRSQNYHHLINKLGENYKPRFEITNLVCPGALVFETPEIYNLDKLKKLLQEYGVECTVFYGEQTFILPIHQNLDEIDLDYISSLFHIMSEKSYCDS